MPDAAEILNDDKHFTYADYKEWELASDERYEIIHGETYAMAAPNAYHQTILVELTRQAANFFFGKPCRVYPAPFDMRLFYEENESDDTVVQPDISVVCDAKKRGRESCHGAPDLVVEILLPSNTAIEMERKFNLYREAGVREYWWWTRRAKESKVIFSATGRSLPVFSPAQKKPLWEFLAASR